MTTERDIAQIVRTWLSSDPADSADRVLALALDQIDTTQQRRATRWPAWRLPRMSSIVRLSAVAAAVALAAILIAGYLVRPNLGGPNDGTPRSPMPSAFRSSTFEVRDGQASTQVDLEIPTDGSLVVEQSMAWQIDLRTDPATATAGPWGILIADVTNATNHVTRFGAQEPISGDDPASFLAGLRGTGSYDVRDEATAEIDGRPALLAEVAAIPAGSDVPHLDVGGEGTIPFNGPNRTYVTAVGERLFLIEVWADAGTDLTRSQEIADYIVGSIRFTQAS